MLNFAQPWKHSQFTLHEKVFFYKVETNTEKASNDEKEKDKQEKRCPQIRVLIKIIEIHKEIKCAAFLLCVFSTGH